MTTELIEGARTQASGISGALDGDSSAMQPMGRTEIDDNPTRLLAVGLAQAYNAIRHLTEEVAALREEIDELRPKRR